MPQRRGTPSPSSAGPAPLPPGAPVDVRVVRARVEGRAVLAAPANGDAAPAAPSGGLLTVPLWLLAGTGPVAWLGSREGGSGWAALVATAVCVAVARGWVRAERRTAAVDERVRARFAPAADAATVVALPDTEAAAAATAATEVTGASAATPDDAEHRPVGATGAGFSARAAQAAGAVSAVSGRLGRGPAVLAGLVATALAAVTVSGVGALLASGGALELVALAGPLALLAVHAKLLVDRAASPVVGEGFLARWADAALLGRDLRVRLASGVAAPALYVVAWQRWDTWWTALGAVAVALLLAVQAAVVTGLARDRDRLPGLAAAESAASPADAVVDLTAVESAPASQPAGEHR